MGLRILLAPVLLAGVLFAEVSPAVAVRQWREFHERDILDRLVTLLRITNTGQDPSQMRLNAEVIARMFEGLGVRTRLLEVDEAPPVVYGELPVEGATQTLIFYAHYDGQPVEPTEWNTGDPFRPVLMSGAIEAGGQPIPLPNPGWPSDPEWRLYARSAGDDKAAIVALAAALEALHQRNIPIRSNLKFFIEGEEEKGSPHIGQILEENRDLLRADAWLFCDGPVHQNRQQQIAFGARGVVDLDLTVYGPRRELHSGHYGNWAPNPALRLARLLASMKDAEGHVLVEGFYDDVVPLSELEQQAIAEIPEFDEALEREMWLAETEGGKRRLEEAINFPSLNIRGLSSGAVGEEAHNVIPATATASLDIRLVKGMDYRATAARVIDHIRRQGYYVAEAEPGEDVRLGFPKVCKVTVGNGYNAVRTPMDLEICRKVIAAVEKARGPVIKLPTLGGSLPLYVFEEILGTPAIVVPIANYDDNQHTHNENLRLQNLWDGMETMAALMTMEDGHGESGQETKQREAGP